MGVVEALSLQKIWSSGINSHPKYTRSLKEASRIEGSEMKSLIQFDSGNLFGKLLHRLITHVGRVITVLRWSFQCEKCNDVAIEYQFEEPSDILKFYQV